MTEVCSVDPFVDPDWDRFVESHPQGWLIHLSGWKRVIERSFPGIHGHYLAVRQGGNIRAAFPVYVVEHLYLGKRLVSIPFATLCHPLAEEDGDIESLLEAALRLGSKEKAAGLEVRAMRSVNVLERNGTAVSREYKIHYLLLEKGPEALKARFDRTCVRQRIARSEKSNLVLSKVEDRAGLRDFYRLYVKTRRRLGLPPHPYNFIESLWDEFAPSGKLVIWMASHADHPVSGLLLLKFRDRVSAEYLVTDETFRERNPNHFLFWHAIRESHREGYRIFDFGRTSESNHGLMDFKRRWGTVVDTLPVYYPSRKKGLQPINGMGHGDKKWIGVLKSVLQHVPDSLLEQVGTMYYRHLG